MNAEARNEIAEGLRYLHLRADANTNKLLEVASSLYAAIDLFKKKGLLDVEELDERKKEVTNNLVAEFAECGMGVIHQESEQDKYTFEGGAKIDCENRISQCKASCCKLPFALSRQDVEEGVVRWIFSNPYVIAHKPDGYCQHLDQEKKCCSVYEQRPVPCRRFDCSKDKRIWLDFENYVVNPRVNDPDFPRCIKAGEGS